MVIKGVNMVMKKLGAHLGSSILQDFENDR